MHIPHNECRDLTERDVALLHRTAQCMPIAADVSRADLLLCCLSVDHKVLVLHHAAPHSISSLYRQDATGRRFSAQEQPMVHQVLREGSGGRLHKQVLSDGAPVIQDVHPITNAAGRIISAMVIETNMIEHERHRRRNRDFRAGLSWLQHMAARGEVENAETLSLFGPFDGIYMVTADREVIYLSGVAANLYRSIGRVTRAGRQPISALEALDEELVEQAFQARRSLETRHEYEDGRVWVRKAIPLRAALLSLPRLKRRLRQILGRSRYSDRDIDAVMVLVHNATETVQKERELNVKSVMIQEVHHRVKNNLQTVAAVLRMQARRTQDEEGRQHLLDAVNRVLSMSVIHEFLSRDNSQTINIKDVCKRITAQVQQVLSQPEQVIEIQVSGPAIYLPANQATATALVINELLLNAVEHGLKDQEIGQVLIELKDLGRAVQIQVEDNGQGLPPGFDLTQTPSLGLQIIRTLVTDDLNGSIDLQTIARPEAEATTDDRTQPPARPAGARAVIQFPK